MSAIAAIKNQISSFEELIIKIGSRLYARRLLDLICKLEAKLELLVKVGFTLPRKTEGQKVHEYMESHEWNYRIDEEGDRCWLGGFASRFNPDRIYLVKYYPVGVKKGGLIKVKIMTSARETIYIYTHEKKIFSLDELKRFIHDIRDIAYYR